ncbi:MAG: hypothetical protein KatS3mg131_2670 [Candidatus Tectimicrobiota bacterium]|nr:MAG: hypothetical protein KatS3mg131_2670 [Candidatus Tectomicrobia bacterium]
MLIHLTLFEFLVALCMGLAALCFFFWGIMEGAFTNVEEVKYLLVERERHEQ